MAQHFGWIPPQHRSDAQERQHEANIRSMPRFAIRGNTRYGTKVALFDWSKEANGGNHLACFRQESGSCVGNGFGKMLWTLASVQRVKLGDMIAMTMPLWPVPYGRSRELAGFRNKGEGSIGSAMARAGKEFGTPPADAPNAPKLVIKDGISFGKKVEIAYSTTTGVDAGLIAAAKPHLIQTTAPVLSADDVRDAVVNGHPVTIASTWGGMMKCQVVEGVLLNRRVTSWGHQMCILAWWEHPKLGEIFWVQNSWGASVHGVCPSGAPPGGFWIKKTDVEFITRQRDSYAFSSFKGFPANDMELDFYVDAREAGQRGRIVLAA